MNKCIECDLVRDMLIEWRRHTNRAETRRREVLEAKEAIADNEARLTALRGLTGRLEEGPARDRVSRDIERAEALMAEAIEERDVQAPKGDASEAKAASFMVAAQQAHTCGHVGYLSEGSWHDGREDFSATPRLYMFEDAGDFGRNMPHLPATATLWPTSLTREEVWPPKPNTQGALFLAALDAAAARKADRS